MFRPMPSPSTQSRSQRRSKARIVAALGLTAALALSPETAEAAPEKYALSMFHFNVQYVAGGLRGFFTTPSPELDLSAEEVEDRIVRESFEPVLDLVAAHPTWGADIELQGYMLDVLDARHSDVLDKLRSLGKSGQIEIVSFHYSDQLFLAHSPEDWRRSAALNRATFERLDVPLSGTVFCQEGQAGPGMAQAMAENGYNTLVFPKNLFTYQHGEGAREPLYKFGDVAMLTYDGVSYDDGAAQIQTVFWFVDDGELFATAGFDPYIAEKFKKDPVEIAKREAELVDLENQGFSITTVGEYKKAIVGKVPLAAPPPLLDGTWQPGSTDGISRWLGGHGIWWPDERDNDVRTLASMAHRELMTAETAAKAAGMDVAAEIAAAFRMLALGEVSDASGINPFRGEIEYGIAHDAEALRIARDVIARAKDKLAKGAILVDTLTGSVTDPPASIADPPSMEPLFEVKVDAGDRATEVTWSDLGDGVSEVRVHFGAGDERLVSATFPGEMGDIVYTPGLTDAPVHAPRDAWAFDHFYLALSDGLIGLAPDRFVVKDQAWVHVAARITPTSGDVQFEDTTLPVGEESTWVFRVVEGDEAKAASVARALNILPEVVR